MKKKALYLLLALTLIFSAIAATPALAYDFSGDLTVNVAPGTYQGGFDLFATFIDCNGASDVSLALDGIRDQPANQATSFWMDPSFTCASQGYRKAQINIKPPTSGDFGWTGFVVTYYWTYPRSYTTENHFYESPYYNIDDTSTDWGGFLTVVTKYPGWYQSPYDLFLLPVSCRGHQDIKVYLDTLVNPPSNQATEMWKDPNYSCASQGYRKAQINIKARSDGHIWSWSRFKVEYYDNNTLSSTFYYDGYYWTGTP